MLHCGEPERGGGAHGAAMGTQPPVELLVGPQLHMN